MAGHILPIKRDVLNDLASRFIINIPENEMADLMTLCNYMEQAHWFYLDIMRPEDPSLPACSFKEFLATMFNHCSELLPHSPDIELLPEQWKSFKHSKPVRGAILLNNNMTKCLLVQGYPASTSWSFPKGKKEAGETDVDAAVREVYEEVGFDIRQMIREREYIEKSNRESTSRMYIVTGVSENEHFEPKSRKEIRRIQWFNIKDLPTHRHDDGGSKCKGSNKFFVILYFIKPLKEWISKRNGHTSRNHSPSPRRRNDHTPTLKKDNSSTLSNKHLKHTQLMDSASSHTPPKSNSSPFNSLLDHLMGPPPLQSSHTPLSTLFPTPPSVHTPSPQISHFYGSAHHSNPVGHSHLTHLFGYTPPQGNHASLPNIHHLYGHIPPPPPPAASHTPLPSILIEHTPSPSTIPHHHHVDHTSLFNPRLNLEPLLTYHNDTVYYPRYLSQHYHTFPLTLQPSTTFCNFRFDKQMLLRSYHS